MTKLELLASGPGTGKTTYCIDLFRQEILKSPAGIDSKSYFVLPNREHAGRIQNLVLRKDVPGLFNVHILTIEELGLRLAGGGALPSPSESTRRSILRHILEDPDEKWEYFEPVKTLAGFHELMSERIQEFKSAGIDAEELERRGKKLMKDAVFAAKSRDFMRVMHRYDRALARRGYAEAEDSLARAKRAEKGIAAQLVILDGFYHFTQSQKELIERLAKRVQHGVVTLTLPENAGTRPDVFEHVESTKRFLLRLGFKSGAGEFSRNRRVRVPALLHLEKSLFDPSASVYKTRQDSVRFMVSETPHDEVGSIAREIRRLHRETDWHYSDMAVILRGVEGYEKSITPVFSEFGIPVSVHERRKTVESGIGLFLHRLCGLLMPERDDEKLPSLLRSGYLPEMSEADAAAYFERLASELLGAKSAREARLRLTTWIGSLRLDPAIDRVPRRAIEGLLVRSEGIYAGGKEAFSPFVYFEDLQRSLETGLYSERPSGKNRVQVYDAVMAIPKEFRVVFVAGLLDQAFPKSITEDPLFKDAEREVLNGKRRRLEIRASRRSGERYFFYVAVTRARERLYLSHPLKDREGKTFLPSAFMEECRRCFAEVPSLSETPWNAERDAERAAAEALFLPVSGIPAAKKKEILAYAAARKDERRFSSILEAGERDGPARFRDVRILEALRSESLVFSATRLESFLTCAFKYFAEQTLKLRAHFEDRLRLDMGTLLHAVLEKYHKQKRTPEQLFADLEVLFSESPLRDEPLYRQHALMKGMRRTLSLFLKRETEHSDETGLLPTHFELEFGKRLDGSAAAWPYLKIGRDGVLLGGKIDRIDVTPGGDKALVIDYKLGQRDLQKKLKDGLEVQLPVYLLAVRRLLGLDLMGAELRFLESGKKASLETDNLERLLKDTERRISDAVERLRGGDIAVRSKSCDLCDFETVCRFEKWKLIYSEADPHV